MKSKTVIYLVLIRTMSGKILEHNRYLKRKQANTVAKLTGGVVLKINLDE